MLALFMICGRVLVVDVCRGRVNIIQLKSVAFTKQYNHGTQYKISNNGTKAAAWGSRSIKICNTYS